METLEVAPAVHLRSREFSIWWESSPHQLLRVNARISCEGLSFRLGDHLDILSFIFPVIRKNQQFSGLRMVKDTQLFCHWVPRRVRETPRERGASQSSLGQTVGPTQHGAVLGVGMARAQ